MLTQFKDYLVSKGTVRDKYIPYYCKWVADCYTACNAQNSTILSPQKKQFFLKQMAKDHEDWQVKQADAALRLYEYFLTSHEKKQSSVSAPSPAEWETVEKNTREALRLRHRSYSTEKTYILWLRTFRGFVSEKTPAVLTGRDIRNFLSSLAVEKKVSPSTQNQALNALVFLFRHVLDRDLGDLRNAVRARYRRRRPVVLTVREIQSIFDSMSGTNLLWVFPSKSLSVDPLENGYDIRTIQELLGHANFQTTMIYTHVATKNILGVKSPLDL